MKKWLKILCPVLAVLVAASAVAVVLAQCKKEEREIIWVNYGESNEIPCLELPGGEYGTYEDFRYIIRKANKPGVPEEWGTREKKVKEEAQPVVNKDYGNGIYLTRYVNTSLEIYRQFVEDFKTAGFAVYSQSDLAQSIYTTGLTYKGNYYTVTYYDADDTLEVTASNISPLSPHLQKENYSTKAAEQEGVETTLTLRNLSGNSMGYVIQLKNGHFIIVDGGSLWDLGKLLTYLEENTPEGEIPVVEAWFVSAGGYDNNSWCNGFYGTESELKHLPELREPVEAEERLRVNGIYYNTPTAEAFSLTAFRQEELDGEIYYRRSTSKNDYHTRIQLAAAVLTSQDGTQTPIYNPMAGQTYYFSGGLTVDILYAEERNTMNDYGMDFKNTTSCYRINAEGKTVIDLGSANENIQKRMLALYPAGLLDNPDVLMAPWKGNYLNNTYRDVFRAPVTMISNKNLKALTGESAEVVQYLQNAGTQFYTFSDGIVTYGFATGGVIPAE